MTCMQHKHMCRLMCHSLETQLGSSLLSPPGATPDFITSSHPNALANGTSLLLLLGQESLDPESLGRRHGQEPSTAHTTTAEKRREELCL